MPAMGPVHARRRNIVADLAIACSRAWHCCGFDHGMIAGMARSTGVGDGFVGAGHAGDGAAHGQGD